MKIEGHSGKVKAVLELIKDGDQYKCSGEFIYKTFDSIFGPIEVRGKAIRAAGDSFYTGDWKIDIGKDEIGKFGRGLKIAKIKEALEKIFLDGKRLLNYKMEMEKPF